MKIEKLTENKIRIILKQEDFADKTTNIYNLFLHVPDSHSLLLEILNKAQEEVGFNTDGYKLLIEASYTSEDTCVFTITKYINDINPSSSTPKQKKYLTVKKKNAFNSSYIYNFNTFEEFCDFCNIINNTNYFSIKNLYKSCILYFYNNTYFLVLQNLNLSNSNLNTFNTIISEFSNLKKYSKNFAAKLQEHGKIIIKNNAISTGIKYFCK